MAGGEELAVGGGLALHDTEASVSRSLIGGNVANRGGDLFAMGGRLTVEASTIAGNYADCGCTQGGGTFADGPLVVRQSTVTGNVSVAHGGHGGGISGNEVDIADSNDVDPASEFEIQLTGIKVLTAADFYL